MIKIKKIFILSVCLLFIVNITGCGESSKAAEETSSEYTNSAKFAFYPSESDESESDTVKNTTPINLNSPPDISLTDPLSSQINSFTAKSSGYEWTYIEKGEEVTIIACGLSPLDIKIEDTQILKLKKYNKIDYTPISLSADIPPDNITVKEWDITALETNSEMNIIETVYDDTLLIDLKPDKIYEITTEWDKSKVKERGFSGKASYIIITENKK